MSDLAVGSTGRKLRPETASVAGKEESERQKEGERERRERERERESGREKERETLCVE